MDPDSDLAPTFSRNKPYNWGKISVKIYLDVYLLYCVLPPNIKRISIQLISTT